MNEADDKLTHAKRLRRQHGLDIAMQGRGRPTDARLGGVRIDRLSPECARPAVQAVAPDWRDYATALGAGRCQPIPLTNADERPAARPIDDARMGMNNHITSEHQTPQPFRNTDALLTFRYSGHRVPIGYQGRHAPTPVDTELPRGSEKSICAGDWRQSSSTSSSLRLLVSTLANTPRTIGRSAFVNDITDSTAATSSERKSRRTS